MSADRLEPKEKDGKWGYTDTKGRWVVPAIYDHAAEFDQDVAAVREGWAPTALYGLINNKGKVILKPQFEELGVLSHGLMAAAKGGKFGFIDAQGHWKIKPTYDSALEFSEGFAAVCIKQRWGFINKKGNVVVPLKYQNVGSFENGIASAVDLNGSAVVINKNLQVQDKQKAKNQDIESRLAQFKLLTTDLIIHPNNPETWFKVAEMLDEAEKEEGRTVSLKDLTAAASPSLQPKLEIESAYRECVRLNPRHQKAWKALGKYLYDCERYRDAIPCYERQVNLAPLDMEVWFYLGQCSRFAAPRGTAGAKLRKSAFLAFNKAASINSRKAAEEFEVYYEIGEMAFMNGDRKNALKYHQKQASMTNDPHSKSRIKQLKSKKT